TIDELLLVIDEKSYIIHAYKTVYNRLGFSKGEIIGKSVLNIHPVERRGEASRIVNEMLIGKANSCPIPLINKFGVQIPVETRVVYGNWDGKPAIFVISKDITQVKLSEEKFSKVFYINPSACGLSDLITGEYIEVNEAFYQLFGFDKNEVIGKTSTELGIWTNEARKALLLRADIDGNVTNIETTLKTKNGDIKHVLISSENIYIQDKSYRYTVVHDISESKKAEAAIRKSETKYRKLFENMTNGFSLNEVIIDDNNKPIDIRLIEANQFYKDFTGLNAVDIKGKTIRELMPDIDMNIFNKYFSVALTGEPAVLEYFSKIFNKHVNVNIYSPEKGFFATIFEDISERKIIENKLKESEEKYRLLIENSGDGILFTNPEGYIYSANPEACRILGRTEEEICSIGRSGIIDVNDPILPIAIAERERTGKFVGELTFVRGDGTLFPGELSSTIFIDSEGNKRTSMIIRDISERKLAEESLKDSRAKYQAIFESTGTATLIVDEDTTINMANNECYSMTGYTAAELIGQRWTRFVAPESLELMIKNHNLRRQNPEAAPKKYEVKLINKNGEIRDGLLDIGIIPGTKKSIVSILDITERKRAEEEIKQKNTEFAELNASKDKFFSIIAHDLRSPFSGFIGIIKMMSDNFIDFSLNELQEISKSMMVSANNLYQLLENLLEWSSMQRDAKGFNPVLTTIDTIVKESMVFSDKLAKQKDIVLKSNVPEDIRITADISMLNSVFRNLISNAIKFTARGGRVEVGLLSKLSDDIKSAHNSKLNNESRLSDDLKSSDTSDYCTIFIKDSGIGMNQDTLSGLFKLDTKVSNFGTEGEPSTGLGLLLCKEFIQKHGGMIWAESEEGKGSTFYFTLPIGESQNKK
ncbi:MAG: hypothetical protein QG635_702, partial [Bacteroidota bacterium]|nr:hypothetical protein [Bacteroidota bacterium]